MASNGNGKWTNFGYVSLASLPNQRDIEPQKRKKNPELLVVAIQNGNSKTYGVVDTKDIMDVLAQKTPFVYIRTKED